MSKQTNPVTVKENLHQRNRHRNGYDFPALTTALPQLSKYVAPNKYGNLSIDFKDPSAVKALNKALLISFYDIKEWDIPQGYLCPPIPGRADYIHNMADLLADVNRGVIPRGNAVNVLDIGTGANCIYPLIGHQEYGWQFVGTEIDDTAIVAAKKNIDTNNLVASIEVRKQANTTNYFKGIVQPNELFDVTICNPPFHASSRDAQASTERKWRNLGIKKTGKQLNFGGTNAELWSEGGEERFVGNMIAESVLFANSCLWFTSLVSRQENLHIYYDALDDVNVKQVETIDMGQGQKISRVIAWTFMDVREQEEWARKRWGKIKKQN